MNDYALYAPYFEHLLDFWEMRHRSNILFLNFEDMKADLMGALRKLTKFYNREYNEEQLKQLADHLSIDNMRSEFDVV